MRSRSAALLMIGLSVVGCGSSGGVLSGAVEKTVTATLRLDLQGHSTLMPANSSRDSGTVVKQVHGKLLSVDGEWLAIEVTTGPGSIPRTVYVREDALITLDEER